MPTVNSDVGTCTEHLTDDQGHTGNMIGTRGALRFPTCSLSKEERKPSNTYDSVPGGERLAAFQTKYRFVSHVVPDGEQFRLASVLEFLQSATSSSRTLQFLKPPNTPYQSLSSQRLRLRSVGKCYENRMDLTSLDETTAPARNQESSMEKTDATL